MSLHRPINVGSTPHEAPETVWNVLIEVEFDPTLSAHDLARLQDTLSVELEETIREVLGPHVYGTLGAAVFGIQGFGEDIPLFPIVVGDTRFTCNLDVVEMVERLCQQTELGQIAYDVRGRAYELGVEVDYMRRPDLDGARQAELPNPELVAQANAQRAEESKKRGHRKP